MTCGRACRTLHHDWGLPAASGPQDKKPQEGSKCNVRFVLSHSLTLFPKPCLSLPILHILPWLFPHPSPDLVLILPVALARDKLQLHQHFR